MRKELEWNGSRSDVTGVDQDHIDSIRTESDERCVVSVSKRSVTNMTTSKNVTDSRIQELKERIWMFEARLRTGTITNRVSRVKIAREILSLKKEIRLNKKILKATTHKEN